MLSIGIVGLPNVGKSTLFNVLTNNHALVANYPFATIEPNTGVVAVPDPRLSTLSELYHSDRIVPATVNFVDIAGLVAGASQGEGLGNQFLANIRNCNAICHVVRAFDDPNITHINRDFDPKRDIDIINTELVLVDLQTLDRRLTKFEKEARSNPRLKPVLETYQRAQKILNDNVPLHSVADINYEHLADLQLLSVKPVIYLFNVDESALKDSPRQAELFKLVSPSLGLIVSAKLEAELNGLDPADAAELLTSYGQAESGLSQIIQAAYKTLGLQSFLTAGQAEVRAWTIAQGATAPQAAGVIHGDFERGFIAAEIVDYHDLLTAGSIAAARAAGKVRTEGKTYIMKPDDVVEFRFNVR